MMDTAVSNLFDEGPTSCSTENYIKNPKVLFSLALPCQVRERVSLPMYFFSGPILNATYFQCAHHMELSIFAVMHRTKARDIGNLLCRS